MAHQHGSKSITKMSSEFKDLIWTKFEAQEGTGDKTEIGLHLFLFGWRGGTTFHIKTQSKVKWNQCNPKVTLNILQKALHR